MSRHVGLSAALTMRVAPTAADEDELRLFLSGLSEREKRAFIAALLVVDGKATVGQIRERWWQPPAVALAALRSAPCSRCGVTVTMPASAPTGRMVVCTSCRAPVVGAAGDEGGFVCPVCGHRRSTAHGVKVHMAKAHPEAGGA